MTTKPKPPTNADNPEESRRFIDMAREMETDESPGATDRALEKIIQPNPKEGDRKRSRSRGSAE